MYISAFVITEIPLPAFILLLATHITCPLFTFTESFFLVILHCNIEKTDAFFYELS